MYSETCEIRTPLGQAKSVPNSQVSSFHMAICTENSTLGPDEVSLFHRMSSFCRVAIHRFHCICKALFVALAGCNYQCWLLLSVPGRTLLFSNTTGVTRLGEIVLSSEDVPTQWMRVGQLLNVFLNLYSYVNSFICFVFLFVCVCVCMCFVFLLLVNNDDRLFSQCQYWCFSCWRQWGHTMRCWSVCRLWRTNCLSFSTASESSDKRDNTVT
jgi:hypothetical protein